VLLCLAIFLLALLPRLGALDRYVTPDELRWVDRSIRFSSALSQGDFAATMQSGHPGVITMWLGSLGIRTLSAQHTLPTVLPDFDPRNAEVARFLAQYLTAARLPVIVVVAINLVVLFVLLSQLIDRRAAFLAAGLVALDPFAVALGSILHVDALMLTFSLNALAALGIALQRDRSSRWLIFSGALAGLAMLSKSPAAILSVATFIIVVTDGVRQRRSVWQVIRRLLIWGVSATVIFFVVYPAMWVAPVKTILRMRTTAENFSETAHTVNFFNGSNERDPGPLFYPVVLAFRSTVVLWLGLIASVILIVRARSAEEQRLRSAAWLYWVFALVFLGVITLGAKKLDRYVLPTQEALVIVSALGLAFVIEKIGTRLSAASWRALSAKQSSAPTEIASSLESAPRNDELEFVGPAQDARRKWLLNGAVVVLLLISAIQFMPVWPLTLRAYNPLLGGYAAAQAVLPVGGGESAEVGRALQDALPAPGKIAVSDIIGTAPHYADDLVPNTAAGLALADRILFTASDFQLTPDVTQKWIGPAAPVLTITVQGQPYAWLYPNHWLAVEREHLAAQHQSTDAIFTDYNGDSAQQPAAQVLSSEIDEATAIDRLTQIAQTHDRLWVIHYAAAPRRILDPVLRLLNTHAIALDEWSTPLSEGTLFALPEGVSFAAKPVALHGNVNFGDNLHLQEAQLLVPRVQPGQAIGIFTEWTATGPAAQLEVSVVDAANHVWSANAIDVPLQEAEARPRGRRMNVPVPLTMPPGEYQLILNVIDTASGSPISTRQGDGSISGIDWPLGSITIDPARTPIDPATRQPPITLNAELGGLRAIGAETPPDPIITGNPWTLSMEWLAQSDRLPVLDVQWDLVANGTVVYSTTLPLNPYSTEQWRTGDVLQSKYDFRVPLDLPAGMADLQFKVIDRATGQPLTDRPVELTPVNIAARPRDFSAPAMTQPLDVKFGELAQLLGADVKRSSTQLTVTLVWQAQAITTTNLTAFVQLIGTDDRVQQQIDNWQLAFDAPTSTWLPGQIIADQYVFEVSSGALSPDAAAIGVGLYNAATGERLPAFAGGQRLPQDRMIIP
jgi:4-amino-4-deoxy-L-arabinose transferase-like glycosyltransferase